MSFVHALSTAQVQRSHMLCSELSHLTAEGGDPGERGFFQEVSILMVVEEGRCTSVCGGFRNSPTGPHLYHQVLGTWPHKEKDNAKLCPHWSRAEGDTVVSLRFNGSCTATVRQGCNC